MGIHLRAAAGDIEDQSGLAGEEADNLRHDLFPHDHLPVWRGAHMAMAAGEVAEVAEVDLEGLQGVELDIDRIDFLQAFLEGSYHRDSPCQIREG